MSGPTLGTRIGAFLRRIAEGPRPQEPVSILEELSEADYSWLFRIGDVVEDIIRRAQGKFTAEELQYLRDSKEALDAFRAGEIEERRVAGRKYLRSLAERQAFFEDIGRAFAGELPVNPIIRGIALDAKYNIPRREPGDYGWEEEPTYSWYEPAYGWEDTPFADGAGGGEIATTPEDTVRKLWRFIHNREMSDAEFYMVFAGMSNSELKDMARALDASETGKALIGSLPPEGMSKVDLQQIYFFTNLVNTGSPSGFDETDLQIEYIDTLNKYRDMLDIYPLVENKAYFDRAVELYSIAARRQLAGIRAGVVPSVQTFSQFIESGISWEEVRPGVGGWRLWDFNKVNTAAEIEKARAEATEQTENDIAEAERQAALWRQTRTQAVADRRTVDYLGTLGVREGDALSMLNAISGTAGMGWRTPVEVEAYRQRLFNIVNRIASSSEKTLYKVSASQVFSDLRRMNAIDTAFADLIDSGEIVDIAVPVVPERLNSFRKMVETATKQGKQTMDAAFAEQQKQWDNLNTGNIRDMTFGTAEEQEYDRRIRRFVTSLPVSEQLSAYKTLSQAGLASLQFQFEVEQEKAIPQPEKRISSVAGAKESQAAWEKARKGEEFAGYSPEQIAQLDKFWADKVKQAEKEDIEWAAKEGTPETWAAVNKQQTAQFNRVIEQYYTTFMQDFTNLNIAKYTSEEDVREKARWAAMRSQPFVKGYTYKTRQENWGKFLSAVDMPGLYAQFKPKEEVQQEAQKMAQGRQWFPLVRY